MCSHSARARVGVGVGGGPADGLAAGPGSAFSTRGLSSWRAVMISSASAGLLR